MWPAPQRADLTLAGEPHNVLHVATERRDARPRGRAAGPEAEPLQITSAEVARVRATAASDRLGRCGAEGAGQAKPRFDGASSTR